GLEAIVGRMLKKAPADRYATAPDVRRALQSYRGGESDDDDATLQTPLADAAAAIARIANETAQVVKAEQSGIFRTLVPMGPIAVDDPIGRGGDAAPLVGREADLVEMWSRVRRVCETAEGKAILLGAEAGMGRRDVVEWVEEQVAEGGWMRVVRAEAGPAARLGRSGLATLLEDLFDGLPPTREEAQTHIGDLLLRWSGSTYEAATSEAIAGALASFLRPEAQGGEREAIIIRRACEAFRLASRDRPVLLTMQAADQADLQTQTFLWHLARSIADSRFRLLMVLTWTEAAGAPVSEARRLLAAFERIGAGTVETYRLAPLSAANTVALLRTMAEVDDEAAGALTRCARGNPLLARELLLYEQQEGNLVEQGRRWSLSPYADPARWPVSLAEVFALRAQLTVGGLPDSSFLRACLDRAAVLGEAFDYGLLCDYLARILGDPARVERAVESLIKAHILAEERDLGNDRLRFAHPALRTALLSTGGASARDQVVHREAAGALEAWYGEDARPYAVPIAEHYLAARDLGRAGYHFGEAGRLAVVEGRTADARALFERAETL
ncbi:MAG: hypothetical protein KC549_03055, partial [Myxococcales bacterium]|nr:hypothetical protein [Myxococcales bacterium]